MEQGLIDFNPNRERARWRPGRRPFLDRSGYQAVVEDLGYPGATRSAALEEWCSSAPYPDEHEAQRTAEAYVDMLVEQAQRVHLLRKSREAALPALVSANLAERSALKRQKSALTKQIRDLEEHEKKLVEDANSPIVKRRFVEGSRGWELVALELGEPEREFEIEEPESQQVLDLEPPPEPKPPAPKKRGNKPAPANKPKNAFDEDAIIEALRKSSSKQRAAELLGWSTSKLTRTCKRLEIDWKFHVTRKVDDIEPPVPKRSGLNPAAALAVYDEREAAK